MNNVDETGLQLRELPTHPEEGLSHEKNLPQD